MPELAFVLAPQQNLFFFELVAALRDELEAHGLKTSLHDGAFPPPRPDLVYALVPPHEYFTLMHGRVGPQPEVLDRTIFICAEQPDTSFFEANVALAARGGAVFDINRYAVQEFARHGIAAEHLQLGWSARWDRLRERDRDIDVLFLGCASDRRLRHLGSYARVLRGRRCHYVISDNSLPNWKPSATFVVDDDKWDLLSRSKVILNLHQDDTPYLEWLRVVQAMANGCAVVSEHSFDIEPLRAGEHFLAGRPEALGLLAEHLLEDGPRRHAMTTAAYELVRHDIPLRAGAEGLVSAARRLEARPVPDPASDFFLQPPPADDPAIRLNRLAPARTGIAAELAPIKRALKDVKLDLMNLQRSFARLLQAGNGAQVPSVQVDRRAPGWSSAAPLVSVIVSLYNYEREIPKALASVARSFERAWEIVIVDDGSEDGSLQAAREWIADHPDAPVLLLRHPVNRGLGPARNTALAFARGAYCFILDADNEIYPECFPRLLEALRTDPEASFAYGLHERFGRGQTLGVANWEPWEPERFRIGNYIDAMAMVRTEVLRSLGGYGTDRRLHGWEDYDLWCRLAEAGGYGVLVRDVLARYRSTEYSMISTTNISPVDAFSLIAERSPTVFGDARPPL